MSKETHTIAAVNGGIGKCVAFTAVLKAIKKQYPNDKIIVVSGYPEVFLNNPNVHKSFQSGNLSYFYSDYIDGKDIRLMLHDPYLEVDYVQEHKHLIQIWCEMNNIKYNGELPEIFLTQRELDFFQKKYSPSEKPIMVIQTNGGASVDIRYSWARDIPSGAAVKIIDHFAEKYNIVHIRREDQMAYAKTATVNAGFREILALTLLSEKRLLIDSFLQHACAALNLPSTVCWIANNPKVLGYKLHDNILANPFTKEPELRNAYLSKHNIGGDLVEYPFANDDEIFDVEKIIASLEKGDEADTSVKESSGKQAAVGKAKATQVKK